LFFHGKAISVTYSESLSIALIIQHAKRMRRTISSSVTSLALLIFLHYFIKGTIFEKKKLLNITCLFWFSL